MAISTVKDFLETRDQLDRVIFVLLSNLDLNVYRENAAIMLRR